MFCGWRLSNSFAELARLGSGELEIDCLTATCRFEQRAIEPLMIARELRAWVQADLAGHAIDPALLERVRLRSRLIIEEIGQRARTTSTVYLGADRKPMRSTTLIRCSIACESFVKTQTATYVAAKSDVEEFPADWPTA